MGAGGGGGGAQAGGVLTGPCGSDEKEHTGQRTISDTLHHNKWSRANVPSINALAGQRLCKQNPPPS